MPYMSIYLTIWQLAICKRIRIVVELYLFATPPDGKKRNNTIPLIYIYIYIYSSVICMFILSNTLKCKVLFCVVVQ